MAPACLISPVFTMNRDPLNFWSVLLSHAATGESATIQDYCLLYHHSINRPDPVFVPVSGFGE